MRASLAGLAIVIMREKGLASGVHAAAGAGEASVAVSTPKPLPAQDADEEIEGDKIDEQNSD